MMELGLSVWHHGDRATIHIGGEIDLATGPQLQAIVVDLVDRDCHHLIFDLEQVSFMDCAGIRVLVDARRRVKEHGGSVRLVRPRPLVWRVLALTGMTTVFPIETSLGRQQRRPRGHLLPHPAGPELPASAQARSLPPSNGRWWRCWSFPAAPTASARSRWPNESARAWQQR